MDGVSPGIIPTCLVNRDAFYAFTLPSTDRSFSAITQCAGGIRSTYFHKRVLFAPACDAVRNRVRFSPVFYGRGFPRKSAHCPTPIRSPDKRGVAILVGYPNTPRGGDCMCSRCHRGNLRRIQTPMFDCFSPEGDGGLRCALFTIPYLMLAFSVW